MSDELIQTQIVATQEPVKKEEIIDQPPQVILELQLEIDRLKKVQEDAEKVAKEAEEKAIYWRKQKAEARAEYFKGDRRVEEKPPAPAELDLGIGPAPRKEDFDDYDKFMEAVVDHRTKTQIAQWRRSEEQKGQQTEYQKKLDGLYEKINKGYEKYPDFEEIARDPSVPITAIVRDILAESEHPEDVAYYLGKNRTEAIRLSRMTQIAATKEITRIEMELAKNPPNLNQPKITSAPPPIKPIGSSESIGKEPEKMNQKEYEEWRKSQGAKRY